MRVRMPPWSKFMEWMFATAMPPTDYVVFVAGGGVDGEVAGSGYAE
jgi:hypothetical protein